MRTRRSELFVSVTKLLLSLLLILLVPALATAQISYGTSAFQKEDEKMAEQQKKRMETIYLDTHLDVRGPARNKDKTGRQKIIRTEKRKLRFNKRGEAVKRRHLNNSEHPTLVERIFN
ncbi:hypothetical protein [Pontibacter beigongshangensis]|uniref:hypothetical protein n=1 Tax=Pontibacter beigongshangensis TaxID=2574733 RepID=UPI00164F6A35|nr:hypothetical protein [Pontibacter beigongshangensis]